MKTTSRSNALAVIAGTLLTASVASAQTPSINSGSLGAAGDGVNTAGVVLGLPGAVTAGGDTAAGYSGGAHTTVAYNAALNPASASPFTIEFWAKPAAVTDNGTGPCPLFNRVSAGNRSGWVFFQRDPSTGWDFRMYNGNTDVVGIALTGGSNAQDTWSHVVAVWNGTSPTLFVNGALADDTVSGAGGYNASTSATFSIGSYDTGANPFNGAMDEVAFYGTALTPAQILSHYNTASSSTPGAYSSLVLADGAVEYLQNTAVPEPTTVSLLALGLAGFAAFKFRGRQRK